MLDVLLGFKRIVVGRRKHLNMAGERRIVERINPVKPPGLGLRNLFLEKRMKDDGGGARILEAPHAVKVCAERRRAGHERMREAKTQIYRSCVDGWFPGSIRCGHGALRVYRLTMRAITAPSTRSPRIAIAPALFIQSMNSSNSRWGNQRAVAPDRKTLQKPSRDWGLFRID